MERCCRGTFAPDHSIVTCVRVPGHDGDCIGRWGSSKYITWDHVTNRGRLGDWCDQLWMGLVGIPA